MFYLVAYSVFLLEVCPVVNHVVCHVVFPVVCLMLSPVFCPVVYHVVYNVVFPVVCLMFCPVLFPVICTLAYPVVYPVCLSCCLPYVVYRVVYTEVCPVAKHVAHTKAYPMVKHEETLVSDLKKHNYELYLSCRATTLYDRPPTRFHKTDVRTQHKVCNSINNSMSFTFFSGKNFSW